MAMDIVICLVLMITRVREHGGIIQMTARLPFHYGALVSLIVALVTIVPSSIILQEQNGLITLVALLDVILYVSLNSHNDHSGSHCPIYYRDPIGILNAEGLLHSMVIDNLNKSEGLVTNTTSASKYIPKRPRICIN